MLQIPANSNQIDRFGVNANKVEMCQLRAWTKNLLINNDGNIGNAITIWLLLAGFSEALLICCEPELAIGFLRNIFWNTHDCSL
ncbi:hypothetical protein B9G39_11700 [Zooshikella ganghwensis]|uniref:Uncharacterized protein n=1 Tax=Zooshikella ganghwensis TaxID=202772 RepID=A0A4P9VN41_9GAMM|nr:hypothetical protein B9G39_11700 [Zooshikella ganghwensis]